MVKTYSNDDVDFTAPRRDDEEESGRVKPAPALVIDGPGGESRG